MKKVISIIITLVMVISTLTIAVPTAFAARSTGSARAASSATGGGAACSIADFAFYNASFASGNSATYIVDRYHYSNMSQLGNIYSLKIWVNALNFSSSIGISDCPFGLSNAYINTDTAVSASLSNNTYENTTYGTLTGDLPAAGSSVSFSVTANLSCCYNLAIYYPTDSCSCSVDVTVVGVDSTALNNEISKIQNENLDSGFWTTDSWSALSSAMTNAQNIAKSSTAYQSDIDSALSSLKEARNNLIYDDTNVHGGSDPLPQTPQGVDFYQNIRYGSDGARQIYDIALPKGVTGDVPLILCLHAGGWYMGDKDSFTAKCQSECDKYGIAVAAMNYRFVNAADLSQPHGFRMMDDITAALNNMKSFAAGKGINLSKMMLTGGSAGGYLSLMYGYSRVSEAPVKPVCIFSQCGPTDLADPSYYNGWTALGSPDFMRTLMSCMCGQYIVSTDYLPYYYEALRAVSPVTYVNSNSIPTVICHGAKDTIVSPNQALELNGLLNDYGVTHELINFPNSDHDMGGMYGTDPDVTEYASRVYDQYVQTYLLHKHSYSVTASADATCTEDGYRTYTCACGDTYTETIPAGHDYSVYLYRIEPSCSDWGSNVYKCSRCDSIYYHITEDYFNPDYHAPYNTSVTSVVAPTCTAGGYTNYHCNHCQKNWTGNATSPTGHTPGNWVTLTPATYSKEGTKAKYCTVCQTLLETGTIEKLTYTFAPLEGKKTVIDKTHHFIYGLEEGLSSLDGFIKATGCELVYQPTAAGFGTGTKVRIMVGDELAEEYGIIIYGDVTGDGIVDGFDVSSIVAVSCYEYEYTDECFNEAGDVFDDGYVDVIDLTFVISAANCEINIDQRGAE